ncbi:hypothetical protein LK994_13545 [Ferruginibacter lapsinanis]|uniref:hypothetical protein n=1 Tax=Ferruginibacter lapsinanis TaxID=563172 RepID=UPI001E423BD1|nr:hypothetical protein [Ferruginibacter lapsinanis]UEG49661.1 hypothetical protein LK994_13545 [Ferruginibacter lapsinanis]
MKCSIIFLACAFTAITLSSCKNKNYEHVLIEKFKADKPAFQKMQDEIILKYFSDTSELQKNNRISFLLCNESKKRIHNDYRICDSMISSWMKMEGVVAINFENGGCGINKKFDLVIFELLNSSIDNYTYYYYYSYCNEYKTALETEGCKSIPLANNWSLFIEKK